MVLPKQTLSLQSGVDGTGDGESPPKQAQHKVISRKAPKTLAPTEVYHSFLSVDHVGLGLSPAYGSLQTSTG